MDVEAGIHHQGRVNTLQLGNMTNKVSCQKRSVYLLGTLLQSKEGCE